MEEDIKYAEMIIKELNTYNDLDGIDDIRPLKTVLEHLIKSYKELEGKYNKALEDLVQANRIGKHWKDGFERELESNRENVLEIIKKDKQIEGLENEIQEQAKNLIECEGNYIPKSSIKEIRDKAECQDYYTLSDVIDDLNKLLGDDK